MPVTVNLSSLQYFPVGPKGREWAAQFSCASGDTTLVNLQNNQSISDRAVNLKFAVIDNIGNSGLVSIVMGNLTFSVPPFTRETYALPEDLTNMQITPGSGSVTVTVSESRLVSDQTNSLAVQQTAAATLTYQFIGPYAVSQNQQSTDVNKTALFNPTAADMSYNLILGSSAGNGWLEFVYNFGTKNVILTPTVGNTINGAASLTLAPNAAGYIQSDGANWYANLGTQTGIPVLASGSIAASPGLSVDLSALTAFRSFEFHFTDMTPVNTGVRLFAQFSSNGGVSYISTASYNWSLWNASFSGGGAAGGNGQTSMGMVFSMHNTGTGFQAGKVWFANPFDTSRYAGIQFQFSTIDSASGNMVTSVGVAGLGAGAVAAMNAIQFFLSAGNFTSLKWALYGYK